MAKKDIHVGTSGWTYDDWAGPFYPPEVKGAERLTYYAGQFDTVEVNATFYRLPTEAMINAWNRRLGEGFHLVLKASRLVTHRMKLRDCDEALQTFLDRAMRLRRLKVILWQLPPSLQKDVGRLEDFLSSLPPTVRHAVEFRHASWWDEEVVEVLSRRAAAFVAISHPRLPDDVLTTTDFLYVRFHGVAGQLYAHDYTREELAGWVERLRPHLPGRALYAFFNNDYHAYAPRNAGTLRQLLLRG